MTVLAIIIAALIAIWLTANDAKYKPAVTLDKIERQNRDK
jgi:hypothetical protein